MEGACDSVYLPKHLSRIIRLGPTWGFNMPLWLVNLKSEGLRATLGPKVLQDAPPHVKYFTNFFWFSSKLDRHMSYFYVTCFARNWAQARIILTHLSGGVIISSNLTKVTLPNRAQTIRALILLKSGSIICNIQRTAFCLAKSI